MLGAGDIQLFSKSIFVVIIVSKLRVTLVALCLISDCFVSLTVSIAAFKALDKSCVLLRIFSTASPAS